MKKLLLLSLLSFLSFGVPKNELKFDDLVGSNYNEIKENVYVYVKVTGNVNENITNKVLESLVNLKSKSKNVKFLFTEENEVKSDYTLIINIDNPEFGSENTNVKEVLYNSSIRQKPYASTKADGYKQDLVYPNNVQGTVLLYNMTKSSSIIATLDLVKNDVSLKTVSTKGKYEFYYTYAKTNGDVSRIVYKHYKNLISKKAIDFPNNDDMTDKTLDNLNKNIKKNIKSMDFNLE